jgi:hypothetical protein
MKRFDKWLLSAMALALVIAILLGISTRPESATQLSEQLALNRLERYARPFPLNVSVDDSATVMTVTYGGAYGNSVYLVVTGNTIETLLGDTLDPGFAGIAQGTSVAGPWIAAVCATIEARANYTCTYFQGGDYLAPADFLDSAITDITDGAGIALAAGYARSMSVVIPAQAGSLSIYIHALAAMEDGGTDVPADLTVYSGLTRAAPIWTMKIPDYAVGSTVADTYRAFTFPGPGLTLPANTAAVVRLAAGDTITSGQLSVTATTHGY